MAEENRKLTAQALKLFLMYARHFGVQNLNPQQEKAVAEFLSGSDVFVNLPMGYMERPYYIIVIIWFHSSVAIELSKQHSDVLKKA